MVLERWGCPQGRAPPAPLVGEARLGALAALMAYAATRPLQMGGHSYKPGEVVRAQDIPTRKLQSLLNLRRLVPVADDEPTAAAPRAPRKPAPRGRRAASTA